MELQLKMESQRMDKNDIALNSNISNDILEVKRLCISSNAFKLNGSNLKAEEKESEAERLMFQLGNQFGWVYEAFIPMPKDLWFFTILQKSWDLGVENALEALDMTACLHCQDINTAMCSTHDF